MRIGKLHGWGIGERRGWRGFLYFGQSGHTWSVEVSRTRFAFVDLEVGSRDGDGVTFGIGTPLGSAWLTWEVPSSWARRLRFPSGWGRRTGVQWNAGVLSLRIWHDDSHWPSRGEWTLWRNTWVTGRDRVTTRTLAEAGGMVRVGQWAGDEYPVRARLEETVWRNRFRTRRRLSWWMDAVHEPGGPFPVTPGNPDSDFYDGDDGIFGTGCDVTAGGDLETALASYAETVRRERLRHGGPGWLPAAMREPVAG